MSSHFQPFQPFPEYSSLFKPILAHYSIFQPRLAKCHFVCTQSGLKAEQCFPNKVQNIWHFMKNTFKKILPWISQRFDPTSLQNCNNKLNLQQNAGYSVKKFTQVQKLYTNAVFDAYDILKVWSSLFPTHPYHTWIVWGRPVYICLCDIPLHVILICLFNPVYVMSL